MSLLAFGLSSKHGLIEARPYALRPIAGVKLVTEEGHHPALEESAFVAHDDLGVEGMVQDRGELSNTYAL